MPWQMFMLFSKFESASHISAFAFSMSWGICEVFVVLFWFFCQLFHPFITTTFFICTNKFTFSKFLWLHIQNLLKNSSTQYSQGQLFLLLTLFTSDSTFTSSAATFHFFAIFSSLLTNSLFWLSISVKCHLVLSLREGVNTTTCFAIFLWPDAGAQWPTHQQTLKQATGLASDHDAQLLFTYWFMN